MPRGDPWGMNSGSDDREGTVGDPHRVRTPHGAAAVRCRYDETAGKRFSTAEQIADADP